MLAFSQAQAFSAATLHQEQEVSDEPDIRFPHLIPDLTSAHPL